MSTNKSVSLKELREQFPKYIEAISKGQSFTVVKRSKPIFQLNPISDEGDWQTIADFTTIEDNGVKAEDVLAVLEA
ncbi:type II toxin-antitoxin system prevent-host-death family antitoxin [bacterium]|jgi:prevent-host-death family protein|nr:type II toxin-antitoxin system prevent-host-death family antitoxin [bacterium]NBX98414.1 type II toxin-antitoxin system prevent-host-death family antitoxin [bacterium]NDC94368.1 type II toxin-antitoxin system prevent-host-death family antitoxin [bacterium]NDD83840.1 type II toxin-antitoxin system prevent-host-death family antitoxin [bacterium]NDG29671.1 type II toxin-antitoxin system prevent-host-death family antitoxin [bacterium]